MILKSKVRTYSCFKSPNLSSYFVWVCFIGKCYNFAIDNSNRHRYARVLIPWVQSSAKWDCAPLVTLPRNQGKHNHRCFGFWYLWSIPLFPGLLLVELCAQQPTDLYRTLPTRAIQFRRIFTDVDRVDEFRRRKRVDETPFNFVDVVVAVDVPETEDGFLLRRVERRVEQTSADWARIDGDLW